MNVWMVASVALMIALVPAAVTAMRKSLVDRLVGLELAGAIFAQLMVLVAVGFDRAIFIDVGLSAALLSFGGGLVFARFLERWL